MSPPAWAAYPALGVFVALLAGVGVMIATGPDPPPGVEPVTGDAALFSVGLVAIAAVGALVARRSRRNPTGWLLLAFSLVQVLSPFTYLYAIGAYAGPGDLPAADVAAWLTMWLWIPAIALLGLALLHFPDGGLPSPRWRWVRRTVLSAWLPHWCWPLPCGRSGGAASWRWATTSPAWPLPWPTWRCPLRFCRSWSAPPRWCSVSGPAGGRPASSSNG